MLVSICVGSIRAHTLAYLASSIVVQEFGHWELIIAAQGHDPALLSLLRQMSRSDSRISHIVLDRYGKSRALNEAVKVARGDILAFTDDDCMARSDWLATIVACFEQQPDVGIVAGDVIAAPKERSWISTCPATCTMEYIYRPADEHYAAPHGFYWGGGNFAFRREALERIPGPFDDALGGGTEFPGAEDVDLALRAEALGVVVWTTPRSVIYHTYGRRYGLRNALRHHQSYALGSGALGGKLVLWKHRLSQDWTRRLRADEWIRALIKNPSRGALNLYKSRYYRIGLQDYLSRFEIDSNILSVPKHPVTL